MTREKDICANIKKWLQICIKANPILFGLMIVFIILSKAFYSLKIVKIGRIIDYISFGVVRNDLYFEFTQLIFCAAMAMALTISADFLKTKITRKTSFILKKNLYEQISYHIDFSLYNSKQHNEAYNLAIRGTDSSFIINHLMSSVSSIVSIVSLMVAIGLVESAVTSIGLILMSIVIRFNLKMIDKSFALMKQNLSDNHKCSYVERIIRDPVATKEIILYGLGDYLINKWKRIFRKIKASNKQFEKTRIDREFVFSLLPQVSSLLIIFILYIINQIESIGSFLSVFMSIQHIQFSFKTVGENLAEHKRDSVLIENYYKYFDVYCKNYREKKVFYIQDPGSEDIAVRLQDVSFSYDGVNEALKNVSLTIKKNEVVAIVGENGSGKSTLIHLILGLFHQYSGQIEYCREYDPNYFSAVLQIPGRYYGYTVQENICFGKCEATEKGITEALRELHFDFKRSLNEVVGNQFTGVEFSGGEWQKIALARTTQSKASIIVLDEPTASLDPISEIQVYNKFVEKNKDKGIILITHRLGSIKNADQIVVLDKGSLVEVGTHEELMKKNGQYRKMFDLQAQWYQGVSI